LVNPDFWDISHESELSLSKALFASAFERFFALENNQSHFIFPYLCALLFAGYAENITFYRFWQFFGRHCPVSAEQSHSEFGTYNVSFGYILGKYYW
jgi:hypothetical protein